MKKIKLKDEIVSKRLAIALKKAGFDNVECFGIYHFTNSSETKLYINTYQNKQGIIHHLAPTYSSVCRWLKQEYGIDVEIKIDTVVQCISCTVEEFENLEYVVVAHAYSVTEKRAYEKALLKTLEILNKKTTCKNCVGSVVFNSERGCPECINGSMFEENPF